MTAQPTLNRRLGGATPLAVALAYGGTAWLQVLHAREGGVERNEPGFLVHWLRDGTLALPLVLMVVALATWLTSRALALEFKDPERAEPIVVDLRATAGKVTAADKRALSRRHGH